MFGSEDLSSILRNNPQFWNCFSCCYKTFKLIFVFDIRHHLLVQDTNFGKVFANEPAAFEVLFYKYRNKIKGFAKRNVPTQIDAEEVVRKVFNRKYIC